MQGADDVVDHGEEEPGQVEAGGEHEDAVAPARVQQRGVEIAEVPPPLLGDVLVCDAGAPTFLDNPLALVHLLLLVVGGERIIKEAIFSSVDPVCPLHLGGAITGLLPVHPDPVYLTQLLQAPDFVLFVCCCTELPAHVNTPSTNWSRYRFISTRACFLFSITVKF